jgi:hypothetical protein
MGRAGSARRYAVFLICGVTDARGRFVDRRRADGNYLIPAAASTIEHDFTEFLRVWVTSHALLI